VEDFKHDVSFVVERVSGSHFVEAIVTIVRNCTLHCPKVVVFLCTATANGSFVRITIFICDTKIEQFVDKNSNFIAKILTPIGSRISKRYPSDHQRILVDV
jgi:hypothetical protein